jgi:hypothetical protein
VKKSMYVRRIMHRFQKIGMRVTVVATSALQEGLKYAHEIRDTAASELTQGAVIAELKQEYSGVAVLAICVSQRVGRTLTRVNGGAPLGIVGDYTMPQRQGGSRRSLSAHVYSGWRMTRVAECWQW